jgi:metal-responsive CopG/Arc/MetJ family transcriptional regulator
MPKKVLIALPPLLLEEVDNMAAAEFRTRSDLIREALRRYLDAFKKNQRLIAETRIEALTANGAE